jgi:hypothetical protein
MYNDLHLIVNGVSTSTEHSVPSDKHQSLLLVCKATVVRCMTFHFSPSLFRKFTRSPLLRNHPAVLLLHKRSPELGGQTQWRSGRSSCWPEGAKALRPTASRSRARSMRSLASRVPGCCRRPRILGGGTLGATGLGEASLHASRIKQAVGLPPVDERDERW